MKTVDEYVKMAEEAAGNGAHVAVLMNYRSAIETAVEQAGYCSDTPRPDPAFLLLVAISYAQRLKKSDDRGAVADWGMLTLKDVKPAAGLEAAITNEIAKLQAGGK